VITNPIAITHATTELGSMILVERDEHSVETAHEAAAPSPPRTASIRSACRAAWLYILPMLPTHHLPAFLLTVYVLILIPGPSVLFVVSRGVSLGRRAALATVAGNASGFALQLLLVSVGVGSIVARSDAVFTTLKLIGAAYLVLLGVRNIRNRRELARLFGTPKTETRKPMRRIIREGFFVGATNPKGLIIFTAVLPQFIDRTQGHVTLQLALLGSICILIAVLSDGAWALASGSARQWLGRSDRRLEALTAGGGVTLIGLGVALAVTGRRT
jgi:threonine/homoserine/homoserine lactone efflux protein